MFIIKAVSEVSKHVINLSPVRLGPYVVSSLVCRSSESASLYRPHSNIDCCHVVWQKFVFSKDHINAVILGTHSRIAIKNVFLSNILALINNFMLFLFVCESCKRTT